MKATPPSVADLPDGAAGALVQHEGFSDVARCKRWPEGFYLLNEASGEVRRGRCKATNLCEYCAKLAAIENTELLTLDALYGVAPTVYGLLTTRTPTKDMSGFYEARRQIFRAWRRRWPAVEVAWLLEFTTGRGIRSGGLRRPHWNATIKGVPLDQLDQARDVMREVWCRHVDALPEHQDLQPIRSAGGLMRYIAMHFQKQSQAPPEGFKGSRFTYTRGYLWLPAPQAREAARESLRRKRVAWSVEQAHPELYPDEVHEYATQRAALDASLSFRVVRTLPGNPPRARPPRARSFD